MRLRDGREPRGTGPISVAWFAPKCPCRKGWRMRWCRFMATNSTCADSRKAPASIRWRHRSSRNIGQRDLLRVKRIACEITTSKPVPPEKRRRRKRGARMEDPNVLCLQSTRPSAKAAAIARSKQLLSIEPLETELGRKRRSTCPS